MANIRLLSVDITGDKTLVEILNDFNRLVTTPREQKTAETRKQESVLLKEAETAISTRLGATLVNGKLGQTKVADLEMTPASPIVQFLYNNIKSEYERYLSSILEIKASTSNAATIGQITLTSTKKNYKLPGKEEDITGDDFFNKLDIKGKGYLLDLDPRTKGKATGTNITDLVFDDYFKKDSRLRNMFYAKASSMVLASSVDGANNKLVFLKIPISKFTKDFFKATIVDKAILVSINTSFQNSIINYTNENHIKAIKRVRPIKETLFAGGKKFQIDFLSRSILSGNMSYGLEITKSIKVRPSDIRRPVFMLPKNPQQKESKQAFISGAQWTVLTQKRLGTTMLRFGEPNPPQLKERSGRFRGSVQVFANYRTRTLQYLYNPLYASLEQYGYRPDLQVEGAIRTVAQTLFTQKFNIVKGPGI